MAVLDPARRNSASQDAAWRDRRVNEPTVPMQNPVQQFEEAAREEPEDAANVIQLYKSVAGLLASRGEYKQAYEHLRHALELATDGTEQPHVPQQFRMEVARLRRENAEAREKSIRDSLTASYNRRYLDERLLEVVELQADIAAGGLAVALVDLDWFKSVNDTYGHLVGDRVLQQVVELLQEGLPEGGFCARYGGEEFVLVLPGVDDATATALAEAARDRIERFPWSTIVVGLSVTVSIGVAHGRTPANPIQQLRSADGLLYTAKQSGRNAVAYRVGGEVRFSGAPVRRPR